MPQYRRHFTGQDVVFVTLVTRERIAWLQDERCKQLVLEQLRQTRQRYPFRHCAHVLLEDHLHWLFEPHPGTDPSKLIASLKRAVTTSGKADVDAPLWQNQFYDHVIRNDEDFRRHLDYIHYNPVRHRLVRMACQYRWSSFHAWVARGIYDLTWGTSEPGRIQGMNLE